MHALLSEPKSQKKKGIRPNAGRETKNETTETKSPCYLRSGTRNDRRPWGCRTSSSLSSSLSDCVPDGGAGSLSVERDFFPISRVSSFLNVPSVSASSYLGLGLVSPRLSGTSGSPPDATLNFNSAELTGNTWVFALALSAGVGNTSQCQMFI